MDDLKIPPFDREGFQTRLKVVTGTFKSIREYSRKCSLIDKTQPNPFKISSYLKKEGASLPMLDYYYALSAAANLPFDYLALGETSETHSMKKLKMMEAYTKRLEKRIKTLELEADYHHLNQRLNNTKPVG